MARIRTLMHARSRSHAFSFTLGTLSLLGGAAMAQDSSHLPEIEVRGPRDATIGAADSASEGAAEREVFRARPKLRPGDIVEAVPGVVATQHSGDGKANQYFLRGFNLDHGTDFAVSVDGMPVNMPTHGHGQGYADLNFLIPELVSGVKYRKGPYFAEGGDFSLARGDWRDNCRRSRIRADSEPLSPFDGTNELLVVLMKSSRGCCRRS